MKKEKSVYSLLWKIALIAGLASAWLLFNTFPYNDIRNLYLLPLGYSISMLFVKGYYTENNMGIAVAIIEATKFVRFLVLPLFYALGDTFLKLDMKPSYHSTAVMLMCYEVLAVSLVMYLFLKKKPFREIKVRIKSSPVLFVYLFAFVWILLVLAVSSYRSTLFNFNVSLEEGSSDASSFENDNFVLRYIFEMGKVFMFAMLIGLSSFVKNKTLKFLAVFFASIFYISSNWSDGGESISRWGLVIGLIMSLYAMLVFFPEKKKLILYGGMSSLILVILITSVLKLLVWGYDVSDVSNMSESSDLLFSSNMLDAYFEGVYGVSNGLATVDFHGDKVGFLNFVGEFISHVPGAYHMGLKDYPYAEVYYKLGIHNDALICPSLIQSYYYFGAIGCPFFSCFAVFLALFCTRKMQKESDMTIKLWYLYGIIWLSLYNCINYAIVETHIWYVVFGILICKIGLSMRKSSRYSSGLLNNRQYEI